MNKRGQFYLIIVLVLAFLIYGITGKTNSIETPILFSDFSDLSENYVTESGNIVNDALYSNSPDVEVNVEEFTKEFLVYAKQKNPSIGVLYVYKKEDQVTVANHLDGAVNIPDPVQSSNEEIVERIVFDVGGKEFVHQVPLRLEEFGTEWYTATTTPAEFEISIGGILHNFGDLSGTGPEFKVILRSESGQDPFILGNVNEGILYAPPPEDLNKVISIYKS